MTKASAIQKMPQSYDVHLLFAVLFLVGIGIVMVYSASSAVALKKYGSDFYFLKKQALFSLLGIVALVVCSHIPYRIYRALTYPLLFITFALLITVLVSGLGITAGGSTRWLRFGPLSFQPAEAARLALIIYMAYSLSKKQEELKTLSIGFVPHLLILVLFAIPLLMQPDFGSVVIFGVLVWIMMFVAGVPLRHLLTTLLALLPAAYYLMVNATYRIKRLLSFLDPWQYPDGEGYQIIHSLMAFGTGGLWGTGIGKGYQKLFYLPEPHTDFIFAVIGCKQRFFLAAGFRQCRSPIARRRSATDIRKRNPETGLGGTSQGGYRRCASRAGSRESPEADCRDLPHRHRTCRSRGWDSPDPDS